MWPVWAEFEVFGRPLTLTGYGVFAILGAALATWLCQRAARRFSFPAFDAFAASALALAFGLLGAKTLYIIVSIPEIVRQKSIMPFLSHGGLVWYGGLLGGGLAVVVYLLVYRLDLARFVDCAAPALAVGHALGRIGCFMAGCCWGRPTSLPWGVRFPASPLLLGGPPANVPVHPVQLYEAGAEIVLAAIAWIAMGRLKKGRAFGLWLVGYGVVRIADEVFFRGDDRGAGLFGLPPSVALSLLAILAGALVLAWPRGPAQAVDLTTEKIVS